MDLKMLANNGAWEFILNCIKVYNCVRRTKDIMKCNEITDKLYIKKRFPSKSDCGAAHVGSRSLKTPVFKRQCVSVYLGSCDRSLAFSVVGYLKTDNELCWISFLSSLFLYITPYSFQWEALPGPWSCMIKNLIVYTLNIIKCTLSTGSARSHLQSKNNMCATPFSS